MGNLSEFVSHYIERVVNERDVSGVDEMVADEYRGSGPGWPTTIGELRAFYEDQARERPDWRIDVQATVELGDSVVVQAHAHGAVRAGTSSTRRAVDWLTHYRIADWRIIEINVLSIVTWSDD